jgi:ABC-2 type transport system ATP-binding protein
MSEEIFTTMVNLLSLKNIHKSYPKEKNPALRGVTFDIQKGEIFGLLGPNGAGKSTLINIIAGLLTPDKGNITVFGKDFQKNKSFCQNQMNISTAYANLPFPLTVDQNLNVFARLYSITNIPEKIDEVLEIFGITHLRSKKLSKLSAGQTARVNLCKAFLNNPKLLLLDEPTSSLDPETAIAIRRRLKKLQKERDLTILWTSHNMAEVEEVCDRIAFLLNGEIFVIDTPKNLLKMIKAQKINLVLDESSAKKFSKKFLPESFKILSSDEQTFTMEVPYRPEALQDLLGVLKKQGLYYVDLHIEPPSLEHVFMEIAKKQK